ncbi:hypothetical protein [Serinicoccus marinus]|nr:hypothetical protein [Serinicoccus marinus]
MRPAGKRTLALISTGAVACGGANYVCSGTATESANGDVVTTD